MAFCDPIPIGRDYCQRWGTWTIGHTDCAVGWTDEADHGQLDAGGCDVGCAPCLDYPEEIQRHAAMEDGHRWLRAAAGTRDAMGRRHDLRPRQSWPVPQHGSYEFGSCYDNLTGEQCFNRSACFGGELGDPRRTECNPGCHGQMYTVPGEARCPDGTGVGEPIPAACPDVFYYAGDQKPNPLGTSLRCRYYPTSLSPLTQRLGLNIRRFHRLLSPALPRFGTLPYLEGRESPCMPNVVTACCDKFGQPGFQCASAFANRPDPPDPGRLHWNDDVACRNAFDQAYIVSHTLEIAGGPTRSLKAEADIRTRALEFGLGEIHHPGPVRIDRLDQQGASDQYSTWRRSWLVGCADPDSPTSRIDSYPNCRTRDGRPITIHAHLTGVDAVLYLALIKVKTYRGPYDIEVHARFFAGAWLTWRSGDPSIVPNPENCIHVPEGVTFIDNEGRRFRPPRVAHWFGYHGRLGIGGQRRYEVGIAGPLRSLCYRALDRLEVLEISGWPHMRELEENPRAGVYLGSIKIAFDTTGCA